MRSYLILATVIALVMGAGIAIAQVGDDGVMYACADEKNGDLRLVGNPDDCEKKELSVSWNQQGLPGLDGTDGVDGLPGPPGVDGNLTLANQVCEEDGASVIGFNAEGDIICEVGGATTTTTTTTTLPPDFFDLTGDWTVTVSDQHACGDVAPSVGDTITVMPDNHSLLATWTTTEGDWRFEAEGVPPVFDSDLVGEPGFVFTPEDQPVEAELGADRTFGPEMMYVVIFPFERGDPSCEGHIDVQAERS